MKCLLNEKVTSRHSITPKVAIVRKATVQRNIVNVSKLAFLVVPLANAKYVIRCFNQK